MPIEQQPGVHPEMTEGESLTLSLGGPDDAVADIRAKIQQKIAARTLPCEPCRAVWAGPGLGEPCAACDRPILATQIEFECEQPGDLLRFHQACYVAWEDECQRWNPPSSEIVN
jgi:hypothetical protein